MNRTVYNLYLFGNVVARTLSYSSACAWVKEQRSKGYASARYSVGTIRYVKPLGAEEVLM